MVYQHDYSELIETGKQVPHSKIIYLFIKFNFLLLNVPKIEIKDPRHTQSNRESKSFAKSREYQSSKFGIINLFPFVMPTAACKYSLFAASNSSSTFDAV
ncbi:uncharacterized protein DS421_5g159200 [Arachis hypogaea]|nr:uncharacterized protein DS421_5g159200 [Arachis hypogaea]